MKTGGYGPFFPFKIEMGSIEKLGCKGKNRRKSQRFDRRPMANTKENLELVERKPGLEQG